MCIYIRIYIYTILWLYMDITFWTGEAKALVTLQTPSIFQRPSRPVFLRAHQVPAGHCADIAARELLHMSVLFASGNAILHKEIENHSTFSPFNAFNAFSASNAPECSRMSHIPFEAYRIARPFCRINHQYYRRIKGSKAISEAMSSPFRLWNSWGKTLGPSGHDGIWSSPKH